MAWFDSGPAGLRSPRAEYPLNSYIARALASVQSSTRYIPLTDIHRQLRRERVDIDEDGLSQRLRSLAERAPSVVRRSPSSSRHYRIVVGLFARHLRYLQEGRFSLVFRT